MSVGYFINKFPLDWYKRIKDTWYAYPSEIGDLLLASIKTNADKLRRNQALKAITECATAHEVEGNRDMHNLAQQLRAQIKSAWEEVLAPITQESDASCQGTSRMCISLHKLDLRGHR